MESLTRNPENVVQLYDDMFGYIQDSLKLSDDKNIYSMEVA